MGAYTIRRLLLVIPTLWVVTTLLFIAVRFIPGSVIDLMYQSQQGDVLMGTFQEWNPDMLRAMLGIDVPIWQQYGRWMGNLFLRGSLGVSLWTGRGVVEDLWAKMGVTAELNILGYIVGVPLALAVGLFSGIRQDTIGDYLARTWTILGMSVPYFWLATMVIVFPAVWWGWMVIPLRYVPPTENLLINLKHMALPVAIGVMMGGGFTVRMTRTLVLEVLRQDYVRTAWSKGLRERVVVLRHVLKNAFIPIITMIGNIIPIMIGGNVIVEQIFSLPGVGRYFLSAVTERDYPIVIGVVFISSVLVLINNVFVDLTYAWLDPRIRYR